jgi:hypothetical protein
MSSNVGTNYYSSTRWGSAVIRAITLDVLIISLGVFSAKAAQVTTAPGFGPYMVEGGEYTLIPDANVAALLGGYSPLALNFVQPGTFQTFWAERDESITPNITYDVTLNNVSVFSGVPLSVGAAYLYQQFATGQLNYNYANIPADNRTFAGTNNAYYLSHAISHYMGENIAEPSNPYEIQVNGMFGTGATAPDNGAHGVEILNLWAPGQPHDPAHAYQDVLILVPEPPVFALASLGAAALVALRRRK